MRLRSIEVYSAIKFEKRTETLFFAQQIDFRPVVELTIHKDLLCVEVKSDKDHALIPFTNIKCMSLWTAEADEYEKNQEEAKKTKSTLKAHQIKQ